MPKEKSLWKTPAATVWCGLLKGACRSIITKVRKAAKRIMSAPQFNSKNACTGNLLNMIRHAGIRPTRQRLALAQVLFAKGDRHITAETLYDEARARGIGVSLATVYNTLHQFTDAGLLRSIAVDTTKTYFDTNTGNHHHFFLEDRNQVIDVPDGHVEVNNIPPPPEGMEIASVDVVIRVRPVAGK